MFSKLIQKLIQFIIIVILGPIYVFGLLIGFLVRPFFMGFVGGYILIDRKYDNKNYEDSELEEDMEGNEIV